MDPWQQSQQRPQRPLYPQIPNTSAPASVFQSSTSLASVSSLNATSTVVPFPVAMSSNSAPLPSPSAGEPSGYFGSRLTPSSNPAQAPQQSSQRPPQSQPAVAPPAHVGQRGGDGGLPETTPFLQDFSLVAEAAKRAQLACLARDLGDVSL